MLPHSSLQASGPQVDSLGGAKVMMSVQTFFCEDFDMSKFEMLI